MHPETDEVTKEKEDKQESRRREDARSLKMQSTEGKREKASNQTEDTSDPYTTEDEAKEEGDWTRIIRKKKTRLDQEKGRTKERAKQDQNSNQK